MGDAKAGGENLNVILADVRTLSLPEKFDYIICLYDVNHAAEKMFLVFFFSRDLSVLLHT